MRISENHGCVGLENRLYLDRAIPIRELHFPWNTNQTQFALLIVVEWRYPSLDTMLGFGSRDLKHSHVMKQLDSHRSIYLVWQPFKIWSTHGVTVLFSSHLVNRYSRNPKRLVWNSQTRWPVGILEAQRMWHDTTNLIVIYQCFLTYPYARCHHSLRIEIEALCFALLRCF
jgi:hypothetical protein